MSALAVEIRPLRPEDAEIVFAAVQESAADVSPWLPDLAADLTLEEITSWLEAQALHRQQGTAYHYAIVEAGSADFLGGCGLTQVNYRHRFANLYYWVRTSRTRRGAASAAVRQLARFGFDTVGLQRVEIVVAVGNTASRRAAEKAGATNEGVLRNRLNSHGVACDAWMFSLVPTDLA